MPEKRDHTRKTFTIGVVTLLILVFISFIPPFTIKGIHFKRANILSDLITFNDPEFETAAELTEADKEFIKEAELIEQSLTGLNGNAGKDAVVSDININTGISRTPRDEPAACGHGYDLTDEDIVKFEDYSGDGNSMRAFCELLGTASRNRVVRIAFLGDSFIEGDIITADIREQLQKLYDGRGVGFVPFATPLAIARSTVNLNSNGWKSYNLVNKRSSPEQVKDKFTVTGIVNVPDGSASSSFSGVRFRSRLDSWSRARLLFIAENGGTINVTINDTIKKTFNPTASPSLQQLNIYGEGMAKVRVAFPTGSGIYGYGVVLEDTRGVTVDNYSLRSNSGLALFGTDGRLNRQLNEILRYDMVVLQYGLNAMDPNNTDYTAYGQQLRKVINYISSCFPGAVIVVMGVGDRATQRDGNFVTMRAIPAMINEQRRAAEECSVVFWNTFEAMGGENSMTSFVNKNWAAKDYTHLSYRGGKYIAEQFVKAILYYKPGDFVDREPGQEPTSRPARNIIDQPDSSFNIYEEQAADPVPSDSMSHERTADPVILPDTSGMEILKPDTTKREHSVHRNEQPDIEPAL